MDIKKIAAIVLTSLFLGVSGYFILNSFSKPEPQPSSSPSIEPNKEVSSADERDNRRINDIMAISKVLTAYAKDHHDRYPIADQQERISDENSFSFRILKSGGYLSETPKDPVPDKYYGYRSDGQAYELTAALETKDTNKCKMYGNYCIYKFSTGEIKAINLQTYTNKKYNFEFKYPADTMKITKDARDVVALGSLSQDEPIYSMGVTVRDNAQDLALKAWIDKSIKNKTNTLEASLGVGGFSSEEEAGNVNTGDGPGIGFSEEDIRVAGIDSLSQVLSGEGGMERYIIFLKDKKVYIISFALDGRGEIPKEAFNRMITSFKFVEKSE